MGLPLQLITSRTETRVSNSRKDYNISGKIIVCDSSITHCCLALTLNNSSTQYPAHVSVVQCSCKAAPKLVHTPEFTSKTLDKLIPRFTVLLVPVYWLLLAIFFLAWRFPNAICEALNQKPRVWKYKTWKSAAAAPATSLSRPERENHAPQQVRGKGTWLQDSMQS